MSECYTCFPAYSYDDKVKPTLLCIKGDDEKIVRKYMHPTDDVKFTLRLFCSTVECFNKNNKKERINILKKLNYDNIDTIL